MDGSLNKPTVGRTDAQKAHDREAAALRLVHTAEDSYLDLASELIDARKMYANAIEEAHHINPESEEGKKLSKRIEQLGDLVVQIQLIIDDEVDAINEKFKQFKILKDQMNKHLN